MLAEIINFYYNIETDGEQRYMLTLDHYELDRSRDPGTAIDKIMDLWDDISSFSFAIEKKPYIRFSQAISFTEELMRALSESWNSAFEKSDFIPIMRFYQIGDGVPKEELRHLIWFNAYNKKLKQDDYRNAIINTTKLAYLDNSAGAYTISHKDALDLLDQYAYKQRMRAIKSEKYNTISRMHHWYKDEAEALIAEAKATIKHFVYVKKYNKVINDFLVVPSFHIGRYRKAVHLLIYKHDLEFIMTLPMTYNNKNYTILFPVEVEYPL